MKALFLLLELLTDSDAIRNVLNYCFTAAVFSVAVLSLLPSALYYNSNADLIIDALHPSTVLPQTWQTFVSVGVRHKSMP